MVIMANFTSQLTADRRKSVDNMIAGGDWGSDSSEHGDIGGDSAVHGRNRSISNRFGSMSSM